MRSFMCACGRKYLLSDVNRCPNCHKDLTNFSDEGVKKHINRCRNRINPYVYSEKGPGRPSHKEVKRVLSERAFKEHCRNCGTSHCVGCEEGICDKWTPQAVGRCPFCGRVPLLVEKCGTSAIICDECNVKMIDEDQNALISRWNRS